MIFCVNTNHTTFLWVVLTLGISYGSHPLTSYSRIVNSPRPIQNLAFSWGETSRESRPNMRLVAVDQLRKIENDALEANIASFSLRLHWWTCCFVMPGSIMWPSSESVEQIHFICRPAGGGAILELLLGCCRADAGLLLNGCRISSWAEGFPKLFSGLVRASFWPRFWPHSEPVI